MDSVESSRTRALSVADALRQRIIDGHILPGSHLMEVPLANELGVSRTPVRDALSRLADEGLVTYLPNRGFLVRHFTVKDVTDAFTLRSSLEGLGCRLLGERGLDSEGREQLQFILEEQREVLYSDVWSSTHALKWQDLNLDLHYKLLELAGNRWLIDAVQRARKLPIVFDSHSRPHEHGEMVLLYQREHSRGAFEDHLKIVSALTKGQTTRAENLMCEHILTNRDILVHALSKV